MKKNSKKRECRNAKYFKIWESCSESKNPRKSRHPSQQWESNARPLNSSTLRKAWMSLLTRIWTIISRFLLSKWKTSPITPHWTFLRTRTHTSSLTRNGAIWRKRLSARIKRAEWRDPLKRSSSLTRHEIRSRTKTEVPSQSKLSLESHPKKSQELWKVLILLRASLPTLLFRKNSTLLKYSEKDSRARLTLRRNSAFIKQLTGFHLRPEATMSLPGYLRVWSRGKSTKFTPLRNQEARLRTQAELLRSYLSRWRKAVYTLTLSTQTTLLSSQDNSDRERPN